MLSDRVKKALFALGDNFEKTLGGRGITLWEDELSGFQDEGILQACRKFMDDPERKYFPRIGEFKAKIDRRYWPGDRQDDKEPFWWGISGDFGGNSACLKPETLQRILTELETKGDPRHTGQLTQMLRQRLAS